MQSYAITKPSWLSANLELRENDRIIGELTMLKKMSYSLAEARMPDGTIVRFGYTGWTARNIFIQDSSGKDIATVKRLSWFRYDTVVTMDGKTHLWKQKNWWCTRYGCFAPDGTEILALHIRWWGRMTVDAPVTPDKTGMLMLFFGMYMMRLHELEAAGTGG